MFILYNWARGTEKTSMPIPAGESKQKKRKENEIKEEKQSRDTHSPTQRVEFSHFQSPN